VEREVLVGEALGIGVHDRSAFAVRDAHVDDDPARGHPIKGAEHHVVGPEEMPDPGCCSGIVVADRVPVLGDHGLPCLDRFEHGHDVGGDEPEPHAVFHALDQVDRHPVRGEIEQGRVDRRSVSSGKRRGDHGAGCRYGEKGFDHRLTLRAMSRAMASVRVRIPSRPGDEYWKDSTIAPLGETRRRYRS